MDDKLYAKAARLKGDERVAFATEHNLDFWKVCLLTKQLKKGKRASKQARAIAKQAQGNTCHLCQNELPKDTKYDHETGKLYCTLCFMGIAIVRKLLANGVAIDRIAALTAPPVDPFSPDAPDADL